MVCCFAGILSSYLTIEFFFFFFFKQKTAYEMRISDWSSDVCSSDLQVLPALYVGCVLSLLPVYGIQFGLALIFALLVRGNITVLMGLQLITNPFTIVNGRSEEHTSELQSLMRISYAVFCLKKKNKIQQIKQQSLDTNKNH